MIRSPRNRRKPLEVSLVPRTILVVVSLLLAAACSNDNRCEAAKDCEQGWFCDSELKICRFPCTTNNDCAEYGRSRQCCGVRCGSNVDGGQVTTCACLGCD